MTPEERRERRNQRRREAGLPVRGEPASPARRVKARSVDADKLPPRLCRFRGEIVASIDKSCPSAKKVYACGHDEVPSEYCVIEPLHKTDSRIHGLGNQWKKKLENLPPIPACLACELKEAFSWADRVCVACPGADDKQLDGLRRWFPGVEVAGSDATGFHAGVNSVAVETQAEYTVVVHPSVQVDGAFVRGVDKSVSFLDWHNQTAGVGGVSIEYGSKFEIAHDFVEQNGVLFLADRESDSVKYEGSTFHICDCVCQCGVFRTSFLRKNLLDENLEGVFWEVFYRVRDTNQFACLPDMEFAWDRDPTVGFGQKTQAESKHGVRWGGTIRHRLPETEEEVRKKAETAFHVFTHGVDEHDIARLTGEVGQVLKSRGYKALAMIVEKKMVEYKVLRRIVVGENFHRSGWPYAMMNLTLRQNPLGEIQIDDFVEQTFLYRGDNKQIAGYREPWAGIFHHPPYAPDWFWEDQKLQKLWDRPSFVDSIQSMKVAFTLSEHLGAYLRDRLPCPVVVLKHPCEIPESKWGDYEMPKVPRLLSFGWYLRDTQLLRRIPDRPQYTKAWLWPNHANMRKYDSLVKTHEGDGAFSAGEILPYVQNDKFDELLCTSVQVCRVFDASATNGVIDCIVRNAPLIINRHPAVEEYLGKDYPGFYDDVEEIQYMVHRAHRCHEYLKSMDKSWCDGNVFVDGIVEGINKYAQ